MEPPEVLEDGKGRKKTRSLLFDRTRKWKTTPMGIVVVVGRGKEWKGRWAEGRVKRENRLARRQLDGNGKQWEKRG